MKKLLALLLTFLMLLPLIPVIAEEAPITISLYYSDNPTLPFREDWPALKAIQEKFNVKLNIEAVPMADFGTKVSTALSTGQNAPDVIHGVNTSSKYAPLALNGAAVPISDYTDWTPNFNARIEELGLQENIESIRLSDGKYYYLPTLWEKPIYDGGLILREDYLEKKGFAAPKTFDDLYQILKAYKEDYPDSLPLTTIINPGVLYRMTMPSWGISVGQYSSTGTGVLSWDYDKKEYFTAAISDQYKDYITFFAKLYAEGLLDPEMKQDDTSTAKKLATGQAVATYGYYDQIGGWTEGTEIEGFKLNLYPVLSGPGGAHHQPRNRVGGGLMFPVGTAARPDFEQIVRKLDEVFYSEEAEKIWCLGIEGESYTMDGDKIVFAEDITSSPAGIFKTMQNAWGCGTIQMVWYLDREMAKYDENFAAINATVAQMDNAIQSVPPTPFFDDLTAEDAALMQTALYDAFEVWNDAFLTGKKSLESDWDAYVQEMKDKGIEQFCALYNEYKH